MVSKRKNIDNLENDDFIRIMDIQTKQISELSRKDFQEKLQEIIEAIEKALSGIKKIGGYELKSFDISVGIKAGWLIVSLEGGITLTYEIPEKQIRPKSKSK